MAYRRRLICKKKQPDERKQGMKRQSFRRFVAMVGIVTLLGSNFADALCVYAAEDVQDCSVYQYTGENSGTGSASDASYAEDPDSKDSYGDEMDNGPVSGSNTGDTSASPSVADRNIRLTAECIDADDHDSVISGHENDALPSFDGTLDLMTAPFEIEGYSYLEARIGGTVADSLSENVAEEKNGTEKTYFWISSDGVKTDLKEDTKVTFVYRQSGKAVKVNASCVDEFGDEIEKQYSDISLPEFDSDGILTLDDAENPPVKVLPVWKGIFKLVKYSYVRATVDGTIITGLKREEAKTAGEGTGTDGLEESYVYSYTADGTEWTRITEDTTVKFEYTDGRKTDFTYEDDNVVVTATLQHAGTIPDDAELKVTPVTADTEGYNYDAYMQALNNSAQKITGKTAADSSPEFTEENTLLYDVAFTADKTDADGNVIAGEKEEYEPTEGMVKISMTFKKKQLSEDLKAENADDVMVAHLPLENSVKETVPTTKDATDIKASDVRVDIVSRDTSVSTGKNDELDFSLDSFSMMGIFNVGLLGASGNQHTVTFSVEGKTDLIDPESVDDGKTATAPDASVISSEVNTSNRTFINWSASTTSDAAYDFSTAEVKEDITLYAYCDFKGYNRSVAAL